MPKSHFQYHIQKKIVNQSHLQGILDVIVFLNVVIIHINIHQYSFIKSILIVIFYYGRMEVMNVCVLNLIK